MSENLPTIYTRDERRAPAVYEGNRTMRMPPEVPLGIGVLGRVRYRSLAATYEERGRALNALAGMIDAECAVDAALVRRAIALDQLRNVPRHIDRYNQETGELAEIAALQRRVERMKLEDEVAQIQERTYRRYAPIPGPPLPPTPQRAFMDILGEIPSVVATAQSVKDDIARRVGPDEPVGEDYQEAVNQMVQEYLARRGEGAR